MNFLIVIIILFVGFFLLVVWGFMKYKNKERMDKNEVYSYIRDGLSLEESLRTAFSNLNKYQALGLHNSTIDKVGNILAGLEKMMDTNNIIEIYSTFIHRYIYRDGRLKKPTNLSDEKIIYALENLDFNERNGYFVIKPDKDEDFVKKYPTL